MFFSKCRNFDFENIMFILSSVFRVLWLECTPKTCGISFTSGRFKKMVSCINIIESKRAKPTHFLRSLNFFFLCIKKKLCKICVITLRRNTENHVWGNEYSYSIGTITNLKTFFSLQMMIVNFGKTRILKHWLLRL